MKALYLPKLRPDQYAIARHPAKVKVLCAGRRWGKSVLGGVLTLLTANAGGRVAWVTPTYRNGRPLWRWMESATAPLASVGVERNRAERTVTFPNGGFVALYTAESPDSVRGDNFHLVVLDEAARIPEDAYTDAIQPTVADTDGDIILISTPRAKNWFYQEWLRASAHGAAWTASSAANPNPNIRKAFDLARERVSERTFREEWLAEFVDDGGGVFRRVREAATAAPQAGPLPGHRYVIGVDLGKLNDFTVFVVIDSTTAEAVHIERLREIDYVLQLARLKALVERWQPMVTVIERNIGEMFIEQAQRIGIRVQAFQTTNASKQIVIDALAMALERGDLRIIPDPALVGELQAYEMERTPGGLLRYGAPSGMHDDTVIALALAWSAAGRAQPLIAFEV